MGDGRFQILSLDGGGYKGMFSAAVLAHLEADLGVSVLEHFDLIAGTSTGGIIALALGVGVTPREVVDFYAAHGPSIFPATRTRSVQRVLRAKYGVAPLRSALEEILGDRILGDSGVPLIIPSYDLRSDNVYLFRTPHLERLRRDWKEPMVDVALATSAAPTYLPAHRHNGLRLIDGGVWANNPALVALVEAMSAFGCALTDVRVFSLGTTSDNEKRHRWLDRGGLMPWAQDAIKVALRGQSFGAKNAVLHLVGEANLLRLDPVVPEGLLRIDGVTADELLGRAAHESRLISDRFNIDFTDHTRRPYTPFHSRAKDEP